MKKVIYIIAILGIVGNIVFLPQLAEKQSNDYFVIRDSIYANKFKIFDTLNSRSKENKLLEKHSFGFIIDSNNYNEFKDQKININMYLHGDSLFLLPNNSRSIIELFKDVITSNKYFSSNYDISARISFIPEGFTNETIIFQETLIKN